MAGKTRKEKYGPLRTCPFCAGKAVRRSAAYRGRLLGFSPEDHGPVWEDLRWYAVKCSECGVSQPMRKYHTREASDAAWNAVPAQPPHEDNDTRTTGGERA